MVSYGLLDPKFRDVPRMRPSETPVFPTVNRFHIRSLKSGFLRRRICTLTRTLAVPRFSNPDVADDTSCSQIDIAYRNTEILPAKTYTKPGADP